jgi:hypothetical protein
MLITDDLYFDSEYCLHELKYLLNSLPNQAIYELRLNSGGQSRRRFAKLNKIAGSNYLGIDRLPLQAIASALNINTQLDFGKQLCVSGQQYLRIDQANVNFDISGWRVAELPRTAEFKQWLLTQRCNDADLLAHVLLQRTDESQRPSRTSVYSTDDRTVFLKNIEVAKAYLKYVLPSEVNLILLGVHLYLLKDLSHFAITYKLAEGDLFKYARKYVLTFHSPELDSDVDIIITTGIKEKNYSLRKFLRHIAVFDGLVESVEYQTLRTH